LQLLEYLYAGKVDCIYIDPPYNTGARDWKYNNDYVDSSDSYRHSKWLSMMEKRLKIAKKLLNPFDSILMLTIDDNELSHIKILLDELFSECQIQIVDMFINPKGKARIGRLSQVDEYLLLVYMGNAKTVPENSNIEGEEIRWPYLRRSDVESARGTTKGGTQQFYPIYVNPDTEKIEMIGTPLLPHQPLSDAPDIPGLVPVFPIREDGKQMNWGLTGASLQYALENGCVRVMKSKNLNQAYNFTYVTMPSIRKALAGEYVISGTRDDGTKIIILPSGKDSQKPTAWKRTAYDANVYGTQLVGSILGEKRFSFPKSLYSVYDALQIYVKSKPNALIVDFFAGSGTTLHAVNLLNAEDGGHRRCIMVTNNEVSDAEAKSLTEQGYKPGDEKWERYGIAQYVTWPRTVCSIIGQDVKGNPLPGDYGIYHEEYISDKQRGKYKKIKVPDNPRLAEMKMADGFKANAIYFKLGFLDKASVRIGRQFREMLPTLWMKAGCFGPCPTLTGQKIPDYMVLPENHMAILNDNSCYVKFVEEVENAPEIETVYLVTDSDADYRSMSRGLSGKQTYQLYRDYMDNFRINSRR
ncbi:MAG: site-specific DNA-methyltransferase, partial [Ruminococcus sp.]|nr:site-specific DNA-methyltransferase [Ruminococcus sp.]